jgi:hypothetical protein
LRVWSPYFTEHHPHPYITIFRELARSPRAFHEVYMGVWQEYKREISIAFDRVRFLEQTPEEAMAYVQRRIEERWAEFKERRARWQARGADAEAGGLP